MADAHAVELLKALLRREVEVFCRRLDPLWRDVAQVVETIQRNGWRAVFFGGTLRSLLLSRLVHGQEGRPRDVDIVLAGPPLDILRGLLGPLIQRETRFGGFHLHDAGWEFDVWPLERTWGIVQDGVALPDFGHLPHTTFLNIEAAAIDIWPETGGERRIYSGDDQFFRSILERVVEVNRAENPYPDLCVVRSLVLVNELGFAMGPRLAAYIANHGRTLSDEQLTSIQIRHYGHVRVSGSVMKGWIGEVSDATRRHPLRPLRFHAGGLVEDGPATTFPYDFLHTVHRWRAFRLHSLPPRAVTHPDS